ncbi:biopolymer transport protein ExbB [Inhella inkyongensis]|uniref:Biopolymer transport protein ExbB n=1 Tax=Inhella inkyongensis TaxID=392593 RepID=A0A840RYI9_9BURK|nr:MotA/TolQ/ExbB proton channel family protein [Inhella inkyongensis]MBB5203025.1 biopolymer transport protein ExbB [Inhella inkyongensis]
MDFWAHADALVRGLGLLLLLMSVCSWTLILWKAAHLRRVRRLLAQALGVFWAAPNWTSGRAQVEALDRDGLLLALIDAGQAPVAAGSLGEGAAKESRLTRQLRDALHRVMARLQLGQVWLASTGATAPFVGLLGTVWGIYLALQGLGQGGAVSIERLAGPVGEALVMTAAGLVVAIPAVLAYNVFGKQVEALEADLEGFAHDLREWLREHG